MTRILLRSNRRFGAVWMLCGVMSGVISLGFVWFAESVMVRGVALLSLVSSIPVNYLGWQFYFVQPRLAIHDSELLVYIRHKSKTPFQVPLDVVEVFFIGQGAVAGETPGQPDDYRGAVAANVIVRIAESAKDWHARDTNSWLGVWQEGYITVRGLWCENINQEVLKTMNRQLMDAKREQRKSRRDG